MGYLSDKYLHEKGKTKFYYLFQVAIAVVLIFFFYFFFQTQCMDSFNEGYKFCRAEFGEATGLNITFYPNGSVEHISVVSEFANLPFDSRLDSNIHSNPS
jgi:hypothetical protein